jgi:hypothetical protein
MTVCSLFFRFTSLLRGKRDRRASLCPYTRGRSRQSTDEEAAVSEKAGLMVEEHEAPPQYYDSKN